MHAGYLLANQKPLMMPHVLPLAMPVNALFSVELHVYCFAYQVCVAAEIVNSCTRILLFSCCMQMSTCIHTFSRFPVTVVIFCAYISMQILLQQEENWLGIVLITQLVVQVALTVTFDLI